MLREVFRYDTSLVPVEALAAAFFSVLEDLTPVVSGNMRSYNNYDVLSDDTFEVTNNCVYAEYQEEVTSLQGWWSDACARADSICRDIAENGV